MHRLIIRRFLAVIPMLFGITFLSFALMHLAGSDAVLERVDASGVLMSAEAIDAQRAALGLNDPFLIQYLRWLGDFLHGDLGVSYVSGEDVIATFFSKLPATLLLTGLSIALTVAVSVPLGVLAAVRQHGATDWLIRAASFVGNSLPNFFVALLLMYLFSIRLPIFPVIAEGTGLASAVLPTLTLAIAMSAKYLRQVRVAVLEEMGKPYVLAARARGIPFRTTLVKSVLRVCLSTIMTLLAMSIGSLLGGTVVVETIFLWDGVGKLAMDAIEMRDYPMIQAYVVWMALIYLLVNLVADLVQLVLDPRLREAGER